MGFQNFDGRTPISLQKHFLAADATNWWDMGYAPSSHQLINAVLLTNSDAIAHVVRVALKISSSYFVFGSVSVPAGAGLAGVAPVELIAFLPLLANAGVLVTWNNQCALALEVAMTGATYLDAVVFGVTF